MTRSRRAVFFLAFPYLCAAVIVGLIAFDALWQKTLPAPAAVRAPVSDVHFVADAVAAEDFAVEAPRAAMGGGDAAGVAGSGPEPGIAARARGGTGGRMPVHAHHGMGGAVATPAAEDPATAQNRDESSAGTAVHAHRGMSDTMAMKGTGGTHAGMMMHHGRHMGGLPPSVYYGSIAVVLVLSFLMIDVRAGRGRAGGDSGERRSPRVDLLRIGWLKSLLAHRATRPLMQAAVTAWFVLIIAAGLFGNQLPTKNIAPLLTWTVWWCGLVLLILYAGKAWCYVCPWDALAGWAEGGGRRTLGLKWPRALRNIWPATLLFIALTWVELGFAVTMKPRATAWFGLAMFGLAFVSAFVFDRKSFCRYGCLVGRISGLYALFSPVEVRARDRSVCRDCSSRACFRGSSAGQACPTFQYLGTMEQNTYCISCMECVKTCDRDNVALNLRPWAEDLREHHKPRSDEAYLALLMLSLTGFHGLTMTGAWSRLVDGVRSTFGVGETVAFTAGMGAIMLGPIVLYAVLVALARLAAWRPSASYYEHFIRYAYGLLPIALFYHLAHNSEHLMMEGQRVVALLSDPFGWEWNLFGTAQWAMGPLIHSQTLWAIQVLLVLVGHVYSLWATHRVAGVLYDDPRAVRRSQLAMLAAMVCFSVMSLWLLKQPMQMRMSWM